MVTLASNFNELLALIKKIVIETLNSINPTHIVFGTVNTVGPLTVQLEQQEIIPKEMIVLARNVTNFKHDVSVDFSTENTSGGSSYSSFESHNHKVTGIKTEEVLHGLKVGDKVVMLQVQGGQRYVILDRVV